MAKTFTLEEVAKHNTDEDIWVVYEDKVLDLTAFLADHPGGEDVLTEAAGQDITQSFLDIGHSETANNLMENYLVGMSLDLSIFPTIEKAFTCSHSRGKFTNAKGWATAFWKALQEKHFLVFHRSSTDGITVPKVPKVPDSASASASASEYGAGFYCGSSPDENDSFGEHLYAGIVKLENLRLLYEYNVDEDSCSYINQYGHADSAKLSSIEKERNSDSVIVAVPCPFKVAGSSPNIQIVLGQPDRMVKKFLQYW